MTTIEIILIAIGLAMVDMEIWYPAVIIGVTTAGLSLVGILLGKRIGDRFGKRIELVGGLILCFIGIRIVVEHLFF